MIVSEAQGEQRSTFILIILKTVDYTYFFGCISLAALPDYLITNVVDNKTINGYSFVLTNSVYSRVVLNMSFSSSILRTTQR